jgi:peroxiredoxin family protein
MSIIVTKGTLDWAYPPFILCTTAAAMGLDVTLFFTFYGLPLLLKDLDLKMSPLGNPAMKMPMMGMHMAMPNLIGVVPGVDAAASAMMKNLIAKKGVASIEELRDLALEAEVKMIACQMTMDLFEYKLEDMIADHTWRCRHLGRAHQLISISSPEPETQMVDMVLDTRTELPAANHGRRKSWATLRPGVRCSLDDRSGSVADFQAFCRTTGNELVDLAKPAMSTVRHQEDRLSCMPEPAQLNALGGRNHNFGFLGALLRRQSVPPAANWLAASGLDRSQAFFAP